MNPETPEQSWLISDFLEIFHGVEPDGSRIFVVSLGFDSTPEEPQVIHKITSREDADRIIRAFEDARDIAWPSAT